MERHLWDVAVVGGGPAGLMCGLTAVGGIPIDPPRSFSAVVIDRGKVGQFARHGKLRITHKWHFQGAEVVGRLRDEAEAANLVLRESEPVRRLDLGDDVKVVETDRQTYEARTVALCTGFFPHADLLDLGEAVRPVFSPAGLEARIIRPQQTGAVAILGAGPSTVSFAAELARLRPDLALSVILEDERGSLDELTEAGIEAHRGHARAKRRGDRALQIEVSAGEHRAAVVHCDLLLVDYNSYTTHTSSTDLLEGTGVQRRAGYVVADHFGRTGVRGVVAAGNIVTPISGALTALSTGFAAGLTLHRWLFTERFGHEPDLFPWLPREGVDAHPLTPQAARSPLDPDTP